MLKCLKSGASRPDPQSPFSRRAPPQGGGAFSPNLLFLYRKTVNISRNLAFGRREKNGLSKASGKRQNGYKGRQINVRWWGENLGVQKLQGARKAYKKK